MQRCYDIDKDIWSQEHLRMEDLPTLGYAMMEVEPVALARVVVSLHGGDEYEKGSLEYTEAIAKVACSIAEMCQLEKEYTGEPIVLVPRVVFREDGRRRLKYSLKLERLRWRDIPSLLSAAKRARYVGDMRALEDQLYELRDVSPGMPSISTRPWEETLDAYVWLGGDLRAVDRYELMAFAVSEMTFCGFTYEEACGGRRFSVEPGGEAGVAEAEEAEMTEEERKWAKWVEWCNSLDDEEDEDDYEVPQQRNGFNCWVDALGFGCTKAYVSPWDDRLIDGKFGEYVEIARHNAYVSFLHGVEEMASHFEELSELVPSAPHGAVETGE